MHKQKISIWFFIGSLLVIYGLLILGSGLYEYFDHVASTVVLGELHAPIWWGILLLAGGIFYMTAFRPGKSR